MPKIQLKNELAQALFEQKIIIINGLEVKLWTGPSHENVKIQESWNKIISFSSYNHYTNGSSGNIVLTGVMQISRAEAAECAIMMGFNVTQSVTRSTDYIVLGSENVSPTKIATAIELNEFGADIQFVDEMTFLQMVIDNYDLIEKNKSLYHDDLTAELDFCNRKSKLLKKQKTPTLDKLEGSIIVISGTFMRFSRKEIMNIVEQCGGKNAGSISSKTNYLLAGKDMGPAKLEKARELNIPIISEEEFIKMIE